MTSWVVAAVSAYEAVAILSRGKVPTITSLTRPLPPARRAFITGLLTMWLWRHMWDQQT